MTGVWTFMPADTSYSGRFTVITSAYKNPRNWVWMIDR